MEKKEIVKEYDNGELTVIWKPRTCIHAAECVKGSPNVFRPNEKPWISIDQATTEELMATIKKCPSGALSYRLNGEEEKEAEAAETKVNVMQNGPLLVHGNLTVTNADGQSEAKEKTTAFCRCGHSNNKPYCDGAHAGAGFEG
jgi:uncharacterized Fe-S cluster protein YjdI